MNIHEDIQRIKEVMGFITEGSRFQKMGEDKYKSCYISDITRMEIIDSFFKKVEEDPTYHTESPDYSKLLDEWDGYDDQVYIQNKLDDNKIVFYEGWVSNCWSAAYKKPEYEGMSKKEVIEEIISKRFPRIAEEFNMTIEDYGYINRNGYVMYVVFNMNE